jgi:hypothetical protein
MWGLVTFTGGSFIECAAHIQPPPVARCLAGRRGTHKLPGRGMRAASRMAGVVLLIGPPTALPHGWTFPGQGHHPLREEEDHREHPGVAASTRSHERGPGRHGRAWGGLPSSCPGVRDRSQGRPCRGPCRHSWCRPMTMRNSLDIRAQLEVVSRELDELDADGAEVSLIEKAHALGVRSALRWALGDTPTV